MTHSAAVESHRGSSMGRQGRLRSVSARSKRKSASPRISSETVSRESTSMSSRKVLNASASTLAVMPVPKRSHDWLRRARKLPQLRSYSNVSESNEPMHHHVQGMAH